MNVSFAAISLIAIGGYLLIEGLGWAIIPGPMKIMFQRMFAMTGERDLHIAGLVSVFIGMALLVFGMKLLG